MKRAIMLIGNPIAGKGAAKKIERAAGIIKEKGFDIRVLLTNKKGDAEFFARQISSESGVRSSELKTDKNSKLLIIAAGGDGTYNEVINGIAGADIPMAILPLGTTNVLAKELCIPESVEGAVEIALKNNAHRVCLGKITFAGGMRYFCLMAGIGYDGKAVFRVSERIKKYSGKGAYLCSGFTTLLSWKPERLTFNIDGNVLEAYSAIICNASKYAGHFRVAPEADIKEPYFYAFLMHGRKRLDIVKYVSGILTGLHLKFGDITYVKAESIEIQGDAHIQVDGDYLGKTPAKIEVVRDALRLIY